MAWRGQAGTRSATYRGRAARQRGLACPPRPVPVARPQAGRGGGYSRRYHRRRLACGGSWPAARRRARGRVRPGLGAARGYPATALRAWPGVPRQQHAGVPGRLGSRYWPHQAVAWVARACPSHAWAPPARGPAAWPRAGAAHASPGGAGRAGGLPLAAVVATPPCRPEAPGPVLGRHVAGPAGTPQHGSPRPAAGLLVVYGRGHYGASPLYVAAGGHGLARPGRHPVGYVQRAGRTPAGAGVPAPACTCGAATGRPGRRVQPALPPQAAGLRW